MSKVFTCPSCSAPMIFEGGDSIFQTCKSCNSPIIVPSEFLYRKEEQLASEEFASLVNDKVVDVEQVTNALTPGSSLPTEDDSIDSEARIERFERYQEKIGTRSIETKKIVDEIVTPKKQVDFKIASPFANDDGSISTDVPNAISVEIPNESKAKKHVVKTPTHPVITRVQDELQKNDKIEAIKVFIGAFNTNLQDAQTAVDAIERGENVNISQFIK